MLMLQEALPEDEVLLFQIYASNRRNEFAMLGMSEPELEVLLRMQYNAQKFSYQQQFPQAKYEKIMYDGKCIGRMITEIKQQAIRLIDIALLPEYRGKGMGTELLRKLKSTAAEIGVPITLHVLVGNRALHLYERCGFYVTGGGAPYVAMKWEEVVK